MHNPFIHCIFAEDISLLQFTSEMDYRPRIADRLIQHRLQGKGAILIEGPKWCGKTTTAKQIAKSILDLGDSAVFENARTALQVNPSFLLKGAAPQLIDEWQTLPALWDMVRSKVDR